MGDFIDIAETKENFGPLYELVTNSSITDIDYNGSVLWLTDIRKGRYRSTMELEDDFVEDFTERITESADSPLSGRNPVIEVAAGEFRITVVHESAAISGRSFCIRRELPYLRLTGERMLVENYCSRQILELLRDAVLAGASIVFCGEKGAGKTECAKYFSQYIPADDRVVTIEEKPEWHYHEVNPAKDCIELLTGDSLDHNAAIAAGLKLGPKWIMPSEISSANIEGLMEGLSMGIGTITTLDTEDVRNAAERMTDMSRERRGGCDIENDIYRYVDIVVLIKRKEIMAGGAERVVRSIDQIASLERDGSHNLLHMIAEEGRLLGHVLPKHLSAKLGSLDPAGSARDKAHANIIPIAAIEGRHSSTMRRVAL